MQRDCAPWFWAALLVLSLACLPSPSPAQQQEQKPGQPLYFPGEEYHEHQSDLAPHTDPYWKRFQQQQQQRIQQGLPQENPYDKPTETIYERTEHYEIVDEPAKGAKPPSRWGQ